MKVKVESCFMCPMRSSDMETGDTCMHPKTIMGVFILPFPDNYRWVHPDCPLYEEPITIYKE